MVTAPPRRFLLLGIACVQNAVNSGLLFGFAAMRPTLDRINEEEGLSADIDKAFTLGVSATMISPLLLAGPLLDACGPRACSTASTCLVGAGFLLFGLSRSLPGTSMAYFQPAILLIGIGGPGCQCSLFHIANLFESKATALNMITASIGPSFMVFEMLSGPASWLGLSLQDAFALYGCLPLACATIGFVAMPDSPFADSAGSATNPARSPTQSPVSSLSNSPASFDARLALADLAPRLSHRLTLGSARPMVFIRRKKTTYRHLRSGDDDSLLEPSADKNFNTRRPESGLGNLLGNPKLSRQLRSTAFAELTLTFAITSCFANVFLGNMQAEAAAVLVDGSETHVGASLLAASYVSLYFRLAPFGGLFNPLLGQCIDRCGLGLMLVIMLTSGTLHVVSLWLGQLVLGFVFFSLFCSGYFSYMYSALAFEFGFEYYGLLAGVVQSVGSVVTLLLQPRFAEAASAHGWSSVQLFEAVSFCSLAALLAGTRLLRSCGQGSGVATPPHSPLCSPSLSPQRSFSHGDLHAQLIDTPSRRRPDLFPSTDDILLIDGAYTVHSVKAYRLNDGAPGHGLLPDP